MRHEEAALQVDVVHQVPGLFRVVGEAREKIGARIEAPRIALEVKAVDEAVQLTALARGIREGLLHGGPVAGVRVHHAHALGEAPGKCSALAFAEFGVDVGDDDRRAAVGEDLAEGKADLTAATGDDDGAPVKTEQPL